MSNFSSRFGSMPIWPTYSDLSRSNFFWQFMTTEDPFVKRKNYRCDPRFPASQHKFFSLTKGSSVGMNCQKKFDLERSLEVGQISLRQPFGKNLTFIICDLLYALALSIYGSGYEQTFVISYTLLRMSSTWDFLTSQSHWPWPQVIWILSNGLESNSQIALHVSKL